MKQDYDKILKKLTKEEQKELIEIFKGIEERDGTISKVTQRRLDKINEYRPPDSSIERDFSYSSYWNFMVDVRKPCLYHHKDVYILH